MVSPNPFVGPGANAVLHERKKSQPDLAEGEKPGSMQKPMTPACRQGLSVVNLSVAVVVLAVMLVGLRPHWIPSPQEQPAKVTNPFQSVFEWVSNNGASVGDIDVVAFDGYYELLAAKGLEKGQTLLSVPMDLILHENTILEDETVQTVLSVTNVLDENGIRSFAGRFMLSC